jgi:hypothetical protein
MTDKKTVHSTKKMTVGMVSVKWVFTAFLGISLLAQAVYAAEQEWWFDVEVIIFKRHVDAADIPEKFKQSRLEKPSNDTLDLITPLLIPDLSYLRAGLPYCRVSNQLAVKTQYEQDFAFPLPVYNTNELSVPQTDAQLEQQLRGHGQQERQERQENQDLASNLEAITKSFTENVSEKAIVKDSTNTPVERFVKIPAQRSIEPSANTVEEIVAETVAETVENTTEASIQYKETTTDIFTQPNDTMVSMGSIATDSNFESVNPAYSTQNNNANVNPQPNTDVPADADLVRPPILVKFIEWQIPSEILCAYAEQIDPSFASITALKDDEHVTQLSSPIERIPDIINGIEWQQRRGAFLLPTATMRMRDLYEKINTQRDMTPILHLNWRQEVKFNRGNGQTFRLFAGENFARRFDANGLPVVDDTDSSFSQLNQSTDSVYIPEQELIDLTLEQQQTLSMHVTGEESEGGSDDLFTRISAALADETPVNIKQINQQTNNYTREKNNQQDTVASSIMLKELWQLDGKMTVYLRNINRIPYLHIDSNLDFRQPIFDPSKAQQTENLSTNLPDQDAVVIKPLLQPSSLQPNSQQTSSQNLDLQKPNFLQSVNFNQLRRVISKQVHYFDHPLFGMVVRLNRYRWPEEEEEEEEEEEGEGEGSTEFDNSQL